jgi:hypothetical protein
MRDPIDRTQRLTDGTRWRTFMRLLRLDDLLTSYTQSACPGAGLLVVDLDFGTASVPPMNVSTPPFICENNHDYSGLFKE